MKLSDLSVNRPVTTVVLFLVLIVLGIFSLGRLAIDLIPDISYPVVAIFSTYPGVAPEEVEENLTRVIESSAASVTNVEKVSSTSREGQAVVIVEFSWGTNMVEAAAEIREKLDLVRDMLPDEASQPVLFKFDPSQIPIMVFTVEGRRDPRSLRYLSENDIKGNLEQIDGVASVQIWGGQEREIHVDLNRTALASYGLSVDQVVGILRGENLNVTGGTVTEGSLNYSLRTLGKFQTLDDIRRTVITTRNGIPITMDEVAEVVDGYTETHIDIRLGDNPAVIGMIQKQSGTNTVQISRRVKEKVADLEAALPPDVNIVEIFTPSDFIENAISSVSSVAWQGGLLALLILFLFLRNLPITLIISVSIPLSVVTTFIFMYLFDLTLNMLSLGGLALGIGMLVDNSIVVLENIFRYRENGAKPAEAAKLGSSEMAMPIVASTFTTVAVFLPLVLFIKGLASELFRDLAFTVTFSLLASLLVALTIIPMLSSRVKRVRVRQKTDSMRAVENELRGRGPVMRFLDRIYSGLLNAALAHRVITLLVILAVFGLTMLMIPSIGIEFLPESDQGQIEITVNTPIGSSLDLTRRAVNNAYRLTEEYVPEADRALIQIGRSGSGFGSESSNVGSISLGLAELGQRDRGVKEIIADLRDRIQGVPGADFRLSAQQGAGGMGNNAALTVSVKGYDLRRGAELARRIKTIMEGIEPITDVRISREEGLPEYHILVDRDRAAQYGMSVAQVGTSIRRAFSGENVAGMVLGGEEVGVRVALRKSDRLTREDLTLVSLATPMGVQVPLSNLVRVERSYGPVMIEREAQQRVIHLNANVQGDMARTVARIQDEVRRISIPPGFSVGYGGSYENLQKTIRDLALVMALAIILVYLIMAAQFESFFDPFLILFTLPMTAVGVIWIHVITGDTLNAVGGIGVVVLAGIVVNNGIILVDYTNLLRKRGYGVLEAVRLAGRTRLRPILMTTLTTVLGLLPMAFSLGSGAEMRTPMARTVIGGLVVSTLFTLVLIPVMYAAFELGKEKRRARRDERRRARELREVQVHG